MNTPASVAWQRETDASGIAWLTLDKPGGSTNVLSRDILVELSGISPGALLTDTASLKAPIVETARDE